MSNNMRRCNACRQFKAIALFGTRQSQCKLCKNNKQQLMRANPEEYKIRVAATKESALVSRLSKMNKFAFVNLYESRHQAENNAMLHISRTVSQALDVKIWQDGTLSDMGIRVKPCEHDVWLPLQIKTSASTVAPWCFKACHKMFHCDVICTSGDNFWVFSWEFMQQNRDSLAGGQNIEIGRHSGKSTVWNVKPLSIVELLQWLTNRWTKLHFVVNATRSERELRTECSTASQIESELILLSRHFAHEIFDWCGQAGPVDVIRDGLRVQYKTATWNICNRKRVFEASTSRTIQGFAIAYEVGQLDMFCFCTVHERLRLFLEWYIPCSAMDRAFEAVAHRDADGMFCSTGRLSMPLSVVSPNGRNQSLHIEIFGCLPKSDADLRSGEYLKVHRLPESYKVPDVLKGRDPFR